MRDVITRLNNYFMDVEETDDGKVDWAAVFSFYGSCAGLLTVAGVLFALTF